MNINRKAFLDMLAYSEGTYNLGSHEGYDVIVGSTKTRGIFAKSLDRHPNVVVELSSTLWSTAAGRYQIIHPTWVGLNSKMKFSDFSADSQDSAALQLIRDAGALNEVDQGHIKVAIQLCKHIWASLPGAGYGQHENQVQNLLNYFNKRFSALDGDV